MVKTVIEEAVKAFNKGQIRPTGVLTLSLSTVSILMYLQCLRSLLGRLVAQGRCS